MSIKFNEGDVVVIPSQIKKKKSLNSVCVIRKIDPTPKQGWVYLIGLLKDCTPSLSSENSAYYRLSVIDKLLPHSKCPKVYGCPECVKDGREWWVAPLRCLKSCYRCRWCEKSWKLQDGVFIEYDG